MTDSERQKLEEIHDFFFKPSLSGKPNRAEQIEDVLSVVRTGKISARIVLYLAGGIVALAAAWNQITGWGK